jgi:Tfp pilus assembly protein PilZ
LALLTILLFYEKIEIEMGLVTSQRISVYYDRFKDIDVTFTKEIIQVTGLLTQQVHLKCGNDFWPCVVYASSFETAKVVANVKTGLLAKLQAANNYVNLRFCFRLVGETNAITFFIAARVMSSAPYGTSQDINMLTLQFTNRPPDDYIEIIGKVLDANVNSSKRKDVRIPLSADNMRKLSILSSESAVFIERVPRRCILRDLSFSGSKIIMMGIEKFLMGKDVALKVDFDDPREAFLIKGKFVRAEPVEGKKEMIALGLSFDEALVPMGYKIRLNEMLSSSRADYRNTLEEIAAQE